VLYVNTAAAAVVPDLYSELMCLVSIRTEAYQLTEELERTKVMVKANFTL